MSLGGSSPAAFQTRAFPKVDVGMALERVLQHEEIGADAFGVARHVCIIQKRLKALVALEFGLSSSWRWVDGDRKQPWHQGVASFPALRLENLVRRAGGVVAQVRAVLAVELAHERDKGCEAAVAAQAFEHGSTRNVVKCADAVHTDNCGTRRVATSTVLGFSSPTKARTEFSGPGFWILWIYYQILQGVL